MAGMIPLDPTGVVTNRVDDYISRSGSVESSTESLAKHWLDALQQRYNNFITVLQRVGESWWLFHVRRDKGIDKDNRQKATALIGRLPSQPESSAVFSLLRNFADACLKQPNAPQEVSGEPRIWSMRNPDNGTVRAVLALALGYNTSLADERALTGVLGHRDGKDGVELLSALQWVAFPSHTLPEGFPAGPGLFITDEPAKVPSEVSPCIERPPYQLLSMRLAELAQITCEPGQKTRLLKRGLGVGKDPYPADLSIEILVWLAHFPTTRLDAFGMVQRDQVVPWLQRLEYATFDELSDLNRRIGLSHEEHGSHLSSRLYTWWLDDYLAKDPFDAYHELFPHDRNAQVELLGEEAQTAWKGLCGNGLQEPASVAGIKTLVQRLAGKSLNCPFTLAGLAWAAETKDLQIMALFKKKLTEQGVPGALADAMLDGCELSSGAHLSAPSLLPAWSWLRAVNPVFFVWYCWRACREWWLACVRLLSDNRRLSADVLLDVAIERCDMDLLRLVGASPTVQALAEPDGSPIRVPVPEEEWHPKANRLVERLYHKSDLWLRLQPPLTIAGMQWLIHHLESRDTAEKLCDRFNRLKNGEHVSDTSLRQLAPLLRGDFILRQVVRLAQSPYTSDRQSTLDTLLHPDCLPGNQRDWLRAYVLTCRQLPAAPDWSARELIILLPILEPVEHVVRAVLGRQEVDVEGERQLLPCLEQRLGQARLSMKLPPPDAEQGSRRPEWVRVLGPVLGWPNTSPSNSEAVISQARIPSQVRPVGPYRDGSRDEFHRPY